MVWQSKKTALLWFAYYLRLLYIQTASELFSYHKYDDLSLNLNFSLLCIPRFLSQEQPQPIRLASVPDSGPAWSAPTQFKILG